MDSRLHRIEALPGAGRYGVTFRRRDGSEHTAVVTAGAGSDAVEVAEASLPPGWTRSTEPFLSTAAAVVAVEAARAVVPEVSVLRDVAGGWDVGLGNVILSAQGRPMCTAHGDMQPAGQESWVCEECGAVARYEL